VPHHFNKSVIRAAAYCPTCNKQTPHYVYDGRLGRCMNDHHSALEPAPTLPGIIEPAPEQIELFNEPRE
jgi:hypothetical protein